MSVAGKGVAVAQSAVDLEHETCMQLRLLCGNLAISSPSTFQQVKDWPCISDSNVVLPCQ